MKRIVDQLNIKEEDKDILTERLKENGYFYPTFKYNYENVLLINNEDILGDVIAVVKTIHYHSYIEKLLGLLSYKLNRDYGIEDYISREDAIKILEKAEILVILDFKSIEI